MSRKFGKDTYGSREIKLGRFARGLMNAFAWPGEKPIIEQVKAREARGGFIVSRGDEVVHGSTIEEAVTLMIEKLCSKSKDEIATEIQDIIEGRPHA